MYRIKNIKTGLYYQPSKGGSNLSKNGKVYTTKLSPLTMDRGADYIDVSFLKRSRVAKTILEHYPLPADWTDRYGKSYEDAYRFSQISMRVPKSDFIVEKLWVI